MTAQAPPPADPAGRLVPLSEVRLLLEREQKDRGGEEGLTYEQRLSVEHSKVFAKIPKTKAEELVKKLRQLPRVSEWHAVKLADVAPTHADDVRAIFAKDRFTLEKDEIDKIIELVQSYL
ncbi:MAG: RNA polymerase Rpb4 family protein [Methanobacteriota archaeon]